MKCVLLHVRRQNIVLHFYTKYSRAHTNTLHLGGEEQLLLWMYAHISSTWMDPLAETSIPLRNTGSDRSFMSSAQMKYICLL